jgi:hypothetical protein
VKLSPAVVRFVCEAAFIILIAAATAVAHLGKLWIALAVGGAWLLVSAVERAAQQQHPQMQSGRLGFLFAPPKAEAVDDQEPEDRVVAADEHPPTPMPEPEPTPEPAPPAPEPQPPTPDPTPPAPQLAPVPPPDPEPEAPRVDPPEPTVTRLPLDGAPRVWNVWELERVARDAEGRDPVRDQEVAFLLIELRQFANAEGQLPASFDAVVRESFGELLYAAV